MRLPRLPATARPSRALRSLLRVGATLLALSTISVVAIVPGLVSLPGLPATATSTYLESGVSQGAQASLATSNATFCGLITPYVSVLPEPATTDFFARLCVQSEFQSIVVAWGGLYVSNASDGSPVAYAAANFTPGLSESRGWTDVDFSINWVSSSNCTDFGPPCAHAALWTGNESTGDLTGPQLDTYPLACACGLAPAGPAPGAWILAGVLILAVLSGAALFALVVVLGGRRRPPERAPGTGTLAPSEPPPSSAQSSPPSESGPR